MNRKIALIRHKLLETINKSSPEFMIYNQSYFSYKSLDELYHLVYLGEEIVCSPYFKIINYGTRHVNYLSFDKEDYQIISMDGRILLRAKRILQCYDDAYNVIYIDMKGKRREVELAYDVEKFRMVYVDKKSNAVGMRSK